MQRKFDALMAQIDRRQRDLAAQEDTINKAKASLSDDRTGAGLPAKAVK